MLHVFSDLEGVRIAMEMERRGESFYRRAAKVSKDPETVDMLLHLAADEQNHREQFERLYKQAQGSGVSSAAYDDETNAYLTAIAAEIVFPQGLMGLRSEGFENPEAVLMHAINSEKDSILFYSELKEHSADDDARKVFDEIIRQERGHMFRLQRQLNFLVNT